MSVSEEMRKTKQNNLEENFWTIKIKKYVHHFAAIEFGFLGRWGYKHLSPLKKKNSVHKPHFSMISEHERT